MNDNIEDEIGLETVTLRIQRRVIRYHPDKFDKIGEYLYLNHGISINPAGPPLGEAAELWLAFRDDDSPRYTYVKPGDYIVIEGIGRIKAYSSIDAMTDEMD